MNPTCLVCYTNVNEPPHGVYTACVKRLKGLYVNTREYWLKREQAMVDAKLIKPEFLNNAVYIGYSGRFGC